MTRPIVLLDVDGVICDFVGGVIRTLADVSDICLTEDDITSPRLSECLSPEAWEIIKAYCHRPGWCRSLQWYPGAQEALKKLQTFSEVFAVTAPWNSATWCDERILWLEPFIPREQIILATRKDLVFGNWLIEDSPDHLTAHPFASPILIDRPWNRYSAGFDKSREPSFASAVDTLERMYG